MSNIHFLLSKQDDDSNIAVFMRGREPLVAHSSHGNFDKIIETVTPFLGFAGDACDEKLDEIAALFDVAKVVADKFRHLTERIMVSGGTVFFDGDPLDNSVTRQVVRFLEEGVNDWQPLVNFMENLASNPNEHSREQLYDWLSRRDFTITAEGDFIGYKGVRCTADGFESISSGRGIVDGVAYNGPLPNNVGSTVEMARSNVQHDPSIGCHVGLHVGSWDYAHRFAQGAVLKVVVNPRDVVSVPTDCDWAKVRCCRYTVLEATAAPITGAYDGDDEDEYCDDCGANLTEGDECEDCEPTFGPDYCGYCNGPCKLGL